MPNPVRLARPIARQILPDRVRLRIADWVARGPLRRLDVDVAAEIAAIREELARTRGDVWHGPASTKSPANASERVVEVPWALSRYRGERSVLDVGTASSFPEHIGWLRDLHCPGLYGIDLRHSRRNGIRMTVGDVRHLPFPAGAFELVFCISTLEHVGLDNSGYHVSATQEVGGDVSGLKEMLRVLTPGGRLLLTLPFGRREVRSWLRQYDLAAWQGLVHDSGADVQELEFFALRDGRWIRADISALPGTGYQDAGARGATGVLCAALSRSERPSEPSRLAESSPQSARGS